MINRIVECFPTLPAFTQKSQKTKALMPDIAVSGGGSLTEPRTITVLHKTAAASPQANEPQTGFTLVCLNGSFFLRHQDAHYPVCKEWRSCFQSIENLSAVPMIWLTITDYSPTQLHVIQRSEGFYPAAAYQKIAKAYEDDRSTKELSDMRYAVVNEPFFVDLQQPAQVSQAYFDSLRGFTLWHHTKALSKHFCAAAFHVQDRPNDPVNLFTSVLKSSVNLCLYAIPREINPEWDNWSGRALALNPEPSQRLYNLFKQSLTHVSKTESREHSIRRCLAHNPYYVHKFDMLMSANGVRFVDNFYDDAEEILKVYIFEEQFREKALLCNTLSEFFTGNGPLVSLPESHALVIAAKTRLFIAHLVTKVHDNNIEVTVTFIPVYVSGTVQDAVLTLTFASKSIYSEIFENIDTHWINQYTLNLSGVHCSEIVQAVYRAQPDIKIMALAADSLLNNSNRIGIRGEQTVQIIKLPSSKKQTQILLQKLKEYGVAL